MKTKRYVIDTNALISYHAELFEETPKLSRKALNIIEQGITYSHNSYNPNRIILFIPSIVFVEIFEKWFRGTDEEFRKEFISTVYQPLSNAENIEIREIDREVVEKFMTLSDPEINLENRDRVILASALSLQADIITSDAKISRYVRKYKFNISVES